MPAAFNGKIFQQDYDVLLSSDGGTSLFCLSERTWRMIVALTETYHWETRYFSSTGEAIDKDTIEAWASQAERELSMWNGCCCGGQPQGSRLRWTKVGGLLEISYDGGETWTPYPEGDTRETGNLFPPIPGDDGPEKRCAAANNLANEMRLEWDELLDQLATIETVLAFSSAVSDILIPFGIVSAAPGLIFTILTALFAAGQTAINDALTPEQFDIFFCCCYDAIGEDGVITEAVWDAIGECMGAEMETTAALAIGLLLSAAGPVGTHNMAQSGTGTGHDCADCGTCDDCTLETASDQGTFGPAAPPDGISFHGAGYTPGDGTWTIYNGPDGTNYIEFDHEICIIQVGATNGRIAPASYQIHVGTQSSPDYEGGTNTFDLSGAEKVSRIDFVKDAGTPDGYISISNIFFKYCEAV